MIKGKKLSIDQVKSIKQLIESKQHTQKEISSMFSISQQAISDLKIGKVWKDVECQ